MKKFDLKSAILKSTLGRLIFVCLIFLGLTMVQEQAWARKHKKFKGVIIVNQILKLEGTITNNGNPAAEYSGIHQGDTLETGDKSMAVVRIPGLAVFHLGANTKVKFTKFNDRNASQIDFLKGQLMSLYRRTGEHEIRLNHSSIKLHGTTLFLVTAPDNPADEICLCDGKIQVTAIPADQASDSAENQSGGKKHRHAKNDVAADGGPSAEKLNAIASSKGAVISAAPTTSAAPAKAGPSPVAGSSAAPSAPSPTIAPTSIPTVAVLEMQVQLASEMAHKQCEVTSKGVEIKASNTLLGLHSDREIKDLESLYALP